MTAEHPFVDLQLAAVPECSSPTVAQIAGHFYAASVRRGISLFGSTDDLADDLGALKSTYLSLKASHRVEALRAACLMIEARARGPFGRVVDAAEAALAMASDPLGDAHDSDDAARDAFAVLASVRDTLEAALRPVRPADLVSSSQPGVSS